MSAESKDEVAQDPNYDNWSVAMDPEKLWKAIIEMHKVDCVSSIDAVKELAARKAYQMIKQGAFETLAQYSERFRETYRAYKATEDLMNPIVIREPDQAMDFFHGLDESKYGEFKVHVKNGWAMKSMKPLKTVNEIYRLAGVWVKPNSRSESGTAATYVTEQVKKEAVTVDKSNTAAKDGDKKPTRDLSKVKCYGCGKKGHLKNSPLCPTSIEREKKANQEGRDAFMNATWCEVMEAGMFATMSCEDELTDYVADAVVNTMQKVALTQVLLDNQADISVIHPIR
jgi:hypothetical protein